MKKILIVTNPHSGKKKGEKIEIIPWNDNDAEH